MADTEQPAREEDEKVWGALGDFVEVPPPSTTPRRPHTRPRPTVPGMLEAVWACYQANEKIMQVKPVPQPHELRWTQTPAVAPEDVEKLRRELLKAKNFINSGDWEGHGHLVLTGSAGIHGLEKKDVEAVSPSTSDDPNVRKSVPRGMVALRFAAHPGMAKGRGARLAAHAPASRAR